MLGHRQLNTEDYLAILRRRWWVILLCAVAGAVGTYQYSRKLPNLYTSQTLVMIEMPRVPENYVKPVVTEQFDRRLGTMREEILSRSHLEPIIDRLGLFKEARGRVPIEDLVERLRKPISIKPVRSVLESTNVLPGFYIAFTAESPQVAQQVCTELASAFMQENLRLREQRAMDTKDFLRDELKEAKHKLDEQDSRLADFKRQYLGQLPDQEQTNLHILTGLNTQLQGVTQELSRSFEDKAHAESLLAQQNVAWEWSKAGTNPQTLEQQLTALQSQLVTLEGRYTSRHPDVIKMRNDIEQLKKKLAAARVVENDKPADAQKAALAEPPHIQQLRNQIYHYERTIAEKTQEKAKVEEQIKLYQSRIQMSPLIEQKYKDLTRDYTTALTFYNELLTKKTQADMATNLEHRQEGEQFRVMDPPNLPQKPSYPDRQLYAGGGLGGGLALGLAFTMLLEARDKSIRTERDVLVFLNLPTLAMLPAVGRGSGIKKYFAERARQQRLAQPEASPEA